STASRGRWRRDEPATDLMSERLVPPADSADDVQSQAAAVPDLRTLQERVVECRACPRLVAWREEVARVKRRSFADETYWGRPVPGWGAEAPRLLIVGLAPAAHGGN